VVRAGEAAAAQGAAFHAEVAPVFLHHDIGGDLRRAKEAVLALVDGELLGDAAGVSGIVVVPAGVVTMSRSWPGW
jgi:hypothetical protein